MSPWFAVIVESFKNCNMYEIPKLINLVNSWVTSGKLEHFLPLR